LIAFLYVAGNPSLTISFPFSIPTFELRYEAVGEVDSQLETFADWKQPRSRCIALECVEASTGRAEIDRAPGPFNSENLGGFPHQEEHT
jgi:hypothetical protein